jgi:hypothetical protein
MNVNNYNDELKSATYIFGQTNTINYTKKVTYNLNSIHNTNYSQKISPFLTKS